MTLDKQAHLGREHTNFFRGSDKTEIPGGKGHARQLCAGANPLLGVSSGLVNLAQLKNKENNLKTACL